MLCVSCKKEVPVGAYCCLCGWKQRLQPEACTLMAVYQKWSNRKYPKIGRHCVRDYSNAFKKLEPLHNVPLPEIDVDDLQDLIDTCPPSASARQKVRVLLSQLSKYAISRDLLQISLCAGLDFSGKKAQARPIFSLEQIKVLQTCGKNKTYKYWQDARILLCLIFTGLRPNELFALRLPNISITQKKIVGGGKTAAGTNRPIPILPAIYDFIAEWYLTSYFLKPQDHENQYLLLNSSGGQKCMDNWRHRGFYPLMFDLGFIGPDVKNHLREVPHLSPYSARHTFATLAYCAGVNKEQLIKIFGHTNFELTSKVYIHEDFEILANEMAKISAYTKESIDLPNTAV